MRRTLLATLWLASLPAVTFIFASPATVVSAEAPKYLSPLVIVPSADGRTLYVAQATANAIAVVDAGGGKVTDSVSLPAAPTGLTSAGEGALLVTCGNANGHVMRYDLKSKALKRLPIDLHWPTAPVVAKSSGTIYVCDRFRNEVVAMDSEAKVLARIAVPREPFAAAITPDEKTLVVANLLPAGAADRNYVAASVSLIDTATNAVAVNVELPNGSNGLRDVCISPDGKYAYVTHILARYQLPTTQLDRGWMNTNALTVLDLTARKRVNTVLLDNVDLGAANPWGVACTADGRYVCAAQAGTHEISVIDREALHQKLDSVAEGKAVTEVSRTVDDVPNDLAFLVGLRNRVRLEGNGPRGLAAVGSTVYAAEYFSDSLAVLELGDDARPRARSIKLGKDVPLSMVRKGEKYFHDASLCFQHWQSCSSCHPGNARVDALNWDLLNDDIGNPKNTKSMLLSHETPPAMSLAVRKTAEDAVRAGIRHIQFAVRPDEDAQAIDAYLKSLQPVPSPHLVGGKMSPEAERGRAVFDVAGCANCHSGPHLTNGRKYDLGFGQGRDKGKLFDTPTLIEVWRTAPYLHDGRAATLKDLLTTLNPSEKHGQTSKLSEQQINDLLQFILSQ